MASRTPEVGSSLIVGPERLQDFINALARAGYEVIGPTVADGAIVYEPIGSIDDLPRGMIDEQDGGTYRLVPAPPGSEWAKAFFAHVVGPHTWKRYMYPPVQRLWSAERRGKGYTITQSAPDVPRYAFFGARACEVAALGIHDKVFDNGSFTDTGYRARRDEAFIVAVNCVRAGGTCFCTSMGTGPRSKGGFDLALTELVGPRRHEFLVEVGTARGARIAAKVGGKASSKADQERATAAVSRCAKKMGRRMVKGVGSLLARNLEHARWDDVASRCLSCANCTMVCPTCFCSTTEDVTSLDGATAERVRKWDSCFTVDFSYIHGGTIRRERSSRYRQWITHKLSTWHEQFGTSGCVGCGRCITWCPVGIDITEEARAIRDSERAAGTAQ